MHIFHTNVFFCEYCGAELDADDLCQEENCFAGAVLRKYFEERVKGSTATPKHIDIAVRTAIKHELNTP